MTKNLFRVALLSAGIAVSAQASANIVVNGSFEAQTNIALNSFQTFTSGLTGWSIYGSVDVVGTNYWTASEGNYSLDLNGNSMGVIYQTLNTVAGQQYQLRFDLAGNPEGGSSVKVAMQNVGGANPEFLFFDAAGNSKSNMGWETQVYNFVAQGSQTLLQFTSLTPGAYGPALDNISVSAVPEPGEWALMLSGLGLMGYIARRRQFRSPA